MKGKLLGLSFLFLFLFVIANVSAGTYNATCDYVGGWDITTATYLRNISVANNVNNIFFKPDGLKVYFTNGQIIYEYNVSSAWNISSMTYYQNITLGRDSILDGLYIREDGLKLYVGGYTNDIIFEYNLSPAWNLTSATYVQNRSVADKENQLRGVWFKPDGTKMYTTGSGGDTVDEYTLSTAWNITTATYVQEIATGESIPLKVWFKPDGTKMYIDGLTTKTLKEYNLTTAWNITTAVYNSNISTNTRNSEPAGAYINPYGFKLYLTGWASPDMFFEYDLNYTLNCTDPTPTDLIEIISPTAQNYTTQNVMINISNKTAMTNIGAIWYNWNGTNVTYTAPVNTTFPAGVYTLQAWANNTSGDEQELSVTFQVYTPPSQSNITQPENKVYGKNNYISWTESVIDFSSLDFYNVTFIGSTLNYSVYTGTNLNTSWDASAIPNQQGYLFMQVCSDIGLCTYSQTLPFNISNFNLTMVEPTNTTYVYFGNIYFNISRDGNEDLWCDLLGDGNIIKSHILYSGTNEWSGNANLTTEVTQLYTQCNIINYTAKITTLNISYNLTQPAEPFDYNISLSKYGNVLQYPQNLFYDTNGELNLMFFSVLNGNTILNVVVLNESNISRDYVHAMNLTINYTNVFNEENQTILMLFDKVSNTRYMVHLHLNGTMEINNYSFANFTVVDRPEMYEPSQLINTLGLVGVSGGYFLFGLPKSTTEWLMFTKEVGSDTLVDTGKLMRGYSIATMVKNTDFTEWYVGGGLSGTSNNATLEYYNGTEFTRIININAGTNYFTAESYKSKVRLSENNMVVTQIGSSARPFMIFNLTSSTGYYSNNTQIFKTTPPLYVSDNIFLFMVNMTGGIRYIICNNQSAISCQFITESDYGYTVPFTDYPLSTNYIDANGINKVTYGKVLGGSPYTFKYNENIYDAKFQCLDEMAEHNLAFNFSVINSNLSTYHVIDSNILGYIIPSSLLGVGLKNIETTCNTSVARGYFLGLDDNYLMDFYGLEESKGLYYTINIVNAFGNPVQGVYLTAQRFSPSKTAFATIQQEVTDTNGDVIFFLEPTILYKLLIIQEGVTIATLSFVPGSSANIELALGSTANPVPFTDGDLVFDDVTFGVTPYLSFFTEDLNITYTVSSAESKLDDVGMIITKKNASGTYTVYNNSLNSPAGASFDYTFNETGSYVVTYYFDHEDYEIYQNVLLYQYGRNSSMSFISEGLLDVGFSGWAYYLFAVVISGLVIGFMSRYSWEGASIMGLLILWAFSIFAPAGMYITEFALADGGVWYIGFIEVTTLTTIVVLALLYRRSTV